MAGTVSRAFAWSGGGTVTTGFTAKGNLIYETTRGSATVELGSSAGGPNGYVYWSGPSENATLSYIIAYASNPGTHSSAEDVTPSTTTAKLGFWKAADGTDLVTLVTFLSNQGIGNLNPVTPTNAVEALADINALDDWYAFRIP